MVCFGSGILIREPHLQTISKAGISVKSNVVIVCGVIGLLRFFWEIWFTISKCCELDAVPLFITRKLPYVTFLFFGKCGMVGFQTHFQYFHPTVEPELARVKAVDGLGYKDIQCTLEPSPHLINFLDRTLPKIGADFTKRFAARKALLQEYADRAQLADKRLNDNRRRQIFASAWKDIVGSDFSAHNT